MQPFAIYGPFSAVILSCRTVTSDGSFPSIEIRWSSQLSLNQRVQGSSPCAPTSHCKDLKRNSDGWTNRSVRRDNVLDNNERAQGSRRFDGAGPIPLGGFKGGDETRAEASRNSIFNSVAASHRDLRAHTDKIARISKEPATMANWPWASNWTSQTLKKR
jgi:hypothetical protein